MIEDTGWRLNKHLENFMIQKKNENGEFIKGAWINHEDLEDILLDFLEDIYAKQEEKNESD